MGIDRYLLLLSLAVGVAFLPTHSLAETPPDEGALRDSLTVQKARTVNVVGRGKQKFYERSFDLNALPHYEPKQKVTGIIRMWGQNYLGDSNLASDWEDAFRKFHPGVTFEYHLLTAFVAMSRLVTGQTDLAPCRKC